MLRTAQHAKQSALEIPPVLAPGVFEQVRIAHVLPFLLVELRV